MDIFIFTKSYIKNELMNELFNKYKRIKNGYIVFSNSEFGDMLTTGSEGMFYLHRPIMLFISKAFGLDRIYPYFKKNINVVKE